MITTFRKTLLLLALMMVSAMAMGQQMATLDDSDQPSQPVPMLKAPMLKYNPVPSLPGDLNRDARYDVADVSQLINVVLGKATLDVGLTGDLTGDGKEDVADVSLLINIVLGKADYPVSVVNLQAVLDGIYLSMRQAGWSTEGNTHQSFGILAYTLMAEVMGDDMMMASQGSGWFWYDACYSVKGRYTSSFWRSYDLWNAYYTWISNANYILKLSQSMTGTEANYVKGQAYALRAYCYFMLAQSFARTLVGHESDPCVPLYTGTDFDISNSTGQPRSTCAQVYAQIDADINEAVNLLNGTTQQSTEHIGHAVALGLRARIALVEEDWTTAYNSAIAAINASGKTIQEVSAFMGLNDATAGNVMWGAQIPEEESGYFASLFAHMSITKDAYGTRAPKQITPWLYNKMSATDTRRAWWDPESGYSTGGYAQLKFDFSDADNFRGDYIYMRVEEMYLTAAEAACRLSVPTVAKNNLNAVMAKRDPNYSCTKTGTELGALTTDETGSLLEEILIQRRLELWGEDGRIYTIRRLHQGFVRGTERGWTEELASGHTWDDPESYAWVLTLPQAELDANPNMDAVTDQNPLGDCSSVGMHISFVESSIQLSTAYVNRTIPVKLTRAITKGSYTATITKVSGDDVFYSTTLTASFADGQNTATVNVPMMDLELGHDYTCELALSAVDQASTDPELEPQIVTMVINVHCANGDAAGQQISFLTESFEQEATTSVIGFGVPLSRAITTNEYRATVDIENVVGEITLDSHAVTFAEGSNHASIWLYAEGIQVNETFSCVLKLSSADAATGGAITSIPVTVTRYDWISLGYGSFESEMFGSTANIPIYQLNGTNQYRMNGPFDTQYNIKFTIQDGKVYILPQVCYNDSNYGEIYMMGYANEDESGYAGDYDTDTKTATLQIRYYCGAGYWPTVTETLTMP